MTYVVVDIETTGFDPTSDDIIEIGAVRMDGNQAVETFHRLIRPSRSIPQEITDLTGISNDMVKTAPALEDALPEFLSFLGDSVMVAHNLQFDRSFIQQKCESIGHTLLGADGLCTLNLARILFPSLSNYRLENVARTLQIDVDETHRGVADALLAGQVLYKLEQKAIRLPLLVLQNLSQLASLYSSITSDWFSQQAAHVLEQSGDTLPEPLDVRDGLVFAKEPERTPKRNGRAGVLDHLEDLGRKASELLGPDGPMSRLLEGYEPRAGQMTMIEKVSEALVHGKHAVIEAGTGTGKSMAYLIPAVLYALATDEKVVVSTHTIALQDQIEQRDFPTLQRLFDGTISLAVQKGRKNYVCLRKIKGESTAQSFVTPMDEIQGVMSLLVWLTETPDGTRDTLSTGAVGHAQWARVQSETDSCINKRCPFFRPCYYFRAKGAAQLADVVVTNHSLLLSDMKADNRVLPKYDALVIDEAHLEEQATKHLGSEVHAVQLAAFANRLSRDRGKSGVLADLRTRAAESPTAPKRMVERLDAAQEWIEEIQRTCDHAFNILGGLVPQGKAEYRLTDAWRQTDEFRLFVQAMDELAHPLKSLEELQQSLQEWAKNAVSDDEAGRIVDASGFLGTWIESVRLLESTSLELPDFVTWIERRGTSRPRWSVHRAPIDVSAALRSALFERYDKVILTSATLSVKGNFDYVVAQLGLQESVRDGKLIATHVPSPFDYSAQAMLCVPNDVPELAKMSPQEAAMWLGDSLYQLAVVSQGRILALFTSHQMLRETAKLIRQPLRQHGLQLLAQEIDGGRTAMLEAFRNNPKSVLLGAQSFWEGIDLPGDQLTTLVIVRLPFAPPTHPVTEARHERIEQNGTSPFWASSLPEAVVRFRQGFGRLIRTRQDKGVVVVYDKRLITQRYGTTFVQSLPGVRPLVAPERDVLSHIQTFLGQSAR